VSTMTLLLRVDPNAPDAASIALASECLRGGGIVAFPTETVYGLGAHALDRTAVRRIFEAKGRPSNDPLIVHIVAFDRIAALTRNLPPDARRLADRFWPGPLTLVLPRSEQVPDEVTAGLDTVAIRIPSHPVAQALLLEADVPVAAPSANLFSRPSPTQASHVLDDLDGRIDMLLDGGSTKVGVESTVLDLAHGTPTVLRPGAVSIETLRSLLPEVVERSAPPGGKSGAMVSPGLLEKHYSPRAPLTLFEGAPELAMRTLAAAAKKAISGGATIGILVPSEEVAVIRGMLSCRDGQVHIEDAGVSTDAGSVARRLYAMLRSLDARQVDLILARTLAVEQGVGVAIQDRLRRAAAGRIVRC
jgi:L-threonylcarbamoyladenylate synthase